MFGDNQAALGQQANRLPRGVARGAVTIGELAL